VKIFADYHTHTCYSHGRGTIEDNVRSAIRQGLEIIGISDHGPANLFGVGVNSADTLLRVRDEVRRLDEKYDEIHVLCGVEANVIGVDGTLDVPEDILSELDYCLVGLHKLIRGKSLHDTWNILGRNMLCSLDACVKKETMEVNTRAITNAVLKHKVFAVTHPGLHLPISTKELALVCRQRGTALEINARHKSITQEFIHVAAGCGVKFVIGSDAHSPEDVGQVARGIHLSKSAGLSVGDILNAKPLHDSMNV
jgi:putative hydrolase